MPYKLFIDDTRRVSEVYKTKSLEAGLPDGPWICAVSSTHAVSIMDELGPPAFISFDHDLGGDDTAMTVAKLIVERDLDLDGQWLPADFSFNVHSANPQGSLNIQSLMDSYLSHRNPAQKPRAKPPCP